MKPQEQTYREFTNKRWFVRLMEIFPGLLTWTALISPIVLSILDPALVAYFIIGFDLYWLTKTLRLNYYLIRGYHRLHRAQRTDWLAKLDELPGSQEGAIDPKQLYHAVIIATFNESKDILEPSIRSLSHVKYPLERIILVVAYEERGGEQVEATVKSLVKEYGGQFAWATAVKHPDGIIGEVKGKGANITFAGRKLAAEVKRRGIDPENVIVTTLDADHRPHPEYFAYLSYLYASDPGRIHRSYQPIPMFYNNIWDAPAPMRVIATGSSFWMIVESMRPHRLRNFAAHAQGLKTLLDTDFWSVTTIVEDGHQYWRTYFTYDGNHKVIPVWLPIYQDAVLAKTYLRTFRAQYLQLRRWAWGISDFSYVMRNSLRNRKIKRLEKLAQIGRLVEGHFSWATAPLILSFAGWLPLLLNPSFQDQVLAHQLPRIASWILTSTLFGLLITVFISLISLPERPPRHRRTKIISMVAQWALLPIVTIFFSAFAAIDAQTRLMLGWYMEFYVTEKSTK